MQISRRNDTITPARRGKRRVIIISVIEIILGAVYYFLLIRIGIEDALTRRIRNKWTGALFLIGLLAALIRPSPADRLVGMVGISLPMLVLGCLCPGSIGGGDVKLMGAAGLLLGRELIITAFVIGIFPAGLYSLGLLLFGKADRKDSIPFGPFLCFGLGLAPFFRLFL